MKLVKININKYTEDTHFMVDDEDFDKVSQWSWYTNINRHTSRTFGIYIVSSNKGKHFRLHRFILNITDPKICIDHIDGNTLNNCKSNLRIATHKENARNQKIRIDNSSGYKGVGWYKRYSRWRSKIKCDGKTIHLGYFTTTKEAARAYDRKAIELFGDFAKTNFPKEDYT